MKTLFNINIMKEVIVRKSNILFRDMAAFYIFLLNISVYSTVFGKKEKDWCIKNNILFFLFLRNVLFSIILLYW